MTRKSTVLFFLLMSFFSLKILFPADVFQPNKETSFLEAEMAWRKKRDEQMRAPTSWLTIAGLFWLEGGENRFGSAGSNKIILPPNSAPAQAGKFILKKSEVTVIANKGIVLKVDGTKIKKMVLRGDDTGKPDILELEDLRMWVIKRGERYAIRLRDLNHPPYKRYEGLDFFPPSMTFKVEADFIPFDSPKTVSVPTLIGTQTEMVTVGYVRFRLNGQEYRLEAFQGDANITELFFIFHDETNGKETYEASRFMSADVLETGKVDLNFNRAYNPPCAYTAYATCPLPPPQNYLKVRIEAGEKKYSGGHH